MQYVTKTISISDNLEIQVSRKKVSCPQNEEIRSAHISYMGPRAIVAPKRILIGYNPSIREQSLLCELSGAPFVKNYQFFLKSRKAFNFPMSAVMSTSRCFKLLSEKILSCKWSLSLASKSNPGRRPFYFSNLVADLDSPLTPHFSLSAAKWFLKGGSTPPLIKPHSALYKALIFQPEYRIYLRSAGFKTLLVPS
jgi:hypothetical protein